MAPEPKTTSDFISATNSNSLKAVSFDTMAFELSLEINTHQFTFSTKRSFLKVLYIGGKIELKNTNFEQYARLPS